MYKKREFKMENIVCEHCGINRFYNPKNGKPEKCLVCGKPLKSHKCTTGKYQHEQI